MPCRLNFGLIVCLILLAFPTISQAENFQGLNMEAQVGELITDNAQVGQVPVTISWSLTQPGGVYNSCFGDWNWEEVVVTIRKGTARDGEEVFSQSGSGQTGSVVTSLVGPYPSQDNSYTAWLSGKVSRPANPDSEECPEAGGEGKDTRPLDEYVVFALPYPEAKDCVFTIVKVRGSAGIEQPQSEVSEKAVIGSTFSPGATLVVKDGGWVEFSNDGGSTVRVTNRSKLTFQSGDCSNSQKFSFKLFFGRIWSTIEKIAGKKNKVDYVTDNATMGVRGTTFEVISNGSSAKPLTRLKVKKGKVSIKNPKTGPTQLVRAGQQSVVKGKYGKPSRPR